MKQNILIVDDQAENIDILYDLLSEKYDISATTSPRNFIKIFNHRIPDLILLDIMMPEIDGYEILRELKKIDPLIDIPVIFVTAKNDPLSEENGFKLGAVDYISKPFNPVILKARIKTHLALREKNLKLEEMISKKDAEILNNKFNNLLNNIDQGVLSFDLDLNIEKGYSKKTLSFFKKEELNSKKIDELLFKDLKHEKKIFNKAINMLKSNHEPSYVQMCLSILPKEIFLDGKYIKLEYKALPKKKFILILEDITETKELEQKISMQQQTQKMIVAIASNRDEFLELKKDFEDFVQNVEFSLKSNNDNMIFLRHLHTFKGLFAQKELNFIVETIHALETKIKDIEVTDDESRKKVINTVKEADLLSNLDKDLQGATQILGKEYFENTTRNFKANAIKNIEKKIKLILEHNIMIDPKILQNILDDILSLNLTPLYTQFISYPSLVAKTADNLGKKIYPMKIKGDHTILVPAEFKNFTKTLIHIYRNCVDHGIEDPDTRDIFYKDEYGTIETNFFIYEKKLIIEISDDGSGININKVIDKALKSNAVTKEKIEELSENEKLMLIFHDRVSTRDEVSHISGRGVGLSAVKEELEKLNGRIEIENQPVQGVMFRFIIPLELKNENQHEIDIIVQQAVSYFKDSLFLNIKSIEELEHYSPKSNIAVLDFTNDLDATSTIELEEELFSYLSSVMLPEGFSSSEIEVMKPEIPKEILNTFAGLAINDFKQLDYKTIGITTPSIISKDNYDRIINNSDFKKFVKIQTNKGSFICSFVKKK
jgi:two-component system chemotaxis sensor kinase CheA